MWWRIGRVEAFRPDDGRVVGSKPTLAATISFQHIVTFYSIEKIYESFNVKSGLFGSHNVGGVKSGVQTALVQRIIDNAVAQWRQRLRACVQAERGHLEHLL